MVRAPPGSSSARTLIRRSLGSGGDGGCTIFGLHGTTALGWMTLEGTKGSGNGAVIIKPRFMTDYSVADLLTKYLA